MKNIILLIAVTASMMSCDKTSNKEVIHAEEQLNDAQQQLNDATRDKNSAVKAKATAEWQYFIMESDSTIAERSEDIRILDSVRLKMNANERQKMNANYNQAKSEILKLRVKLKEKSDAFEQDLEKFDDQAVKENEIFRRNFRNDMERLDKSVDQLFQSYNNR
ncbi:hypothetical protein K0U91_00830 [Chryseobacterium chendengshani]|uniref:hypothetical protein n=1 Tax=Chryseobacterium sp. LJ668 TaxID=2864040 RepID=UPI001C68A683|nr:hypothetical protein [Chryseobacterium sp. LJ668]MBW8523767.1 hypothetical protein [Chryseobacterium sp. LJ668]QYK16711.1 hypothetical protein K0U91_00830 [Chryseobacterium sp. LJ668]